MGRYLLRRIALLIPTLIAVLIFTFVLHTYMPGDEIMERLDLEGKSVSFDRAQYSQSYLELQSQLGLGGPAFYFGLQPSHQPSDARDIIPASYRQRLLQLNGQVKNWSKIMAYHEALQSALMAHEKDPSQARLYRQLNNLERINTIEELRSLSVDLPEEAAELKNVIGQLEPSNAMILPSLRWHGLDNRFYHWVGRLFSADGRVSLVDGVPVADKIGAALRWTLSLSLISLILAIVLSMMIALWQSWSTRSWAVRITDGFMYAIYALPLFWLATLMIVFFTTDHYGSWTNVFPSIGIKPWMLGDSAIANLGVYAKQLILPVFCLLLANMSYLTRQLRTDLKRQREQPYVTSVRAKGVSRWRLIYHHLLPNALVPYITIVTGAIPRALVGSVVIEEIFNLPGVGKLMLQSIHQSDWPVSISIIILVGIVTIFSYILADVLYMIFYPQIAQSLEES